MQSQPRSATAASAGFALFRRTRIKRLVLCLLAVGIGVFAVNSVALAQAKPEFRLGFKALADQIPDIVGVPLESEHWGANGDSLQQSTKGFMVWRKADNWTAFTDGSRTWINGPNGVQSRGNSERFDWEKAAPSLSSPAAVDRSTLVGRGDSGSGQILLRDDFASRSSGLDHFSAPDGVFRGYRLAEYGIAVAAPGVHYWEPIGPAEGWSAITIDVDARVLANDDPVGYGFVVRMKDRQCGRSGYHVVVFPYERRYYIESNMVDCTRVVLADNTSASIRGTFETNHLTVAVMGSELALSVNGTLLAKLRDVKSPDGGVALGAWSNTAEFGGSLQAYSVGEARFSNLVVRAASAMPPGPYSEPIVGCACPEFVEASQAEVQQAVDWLNGQRQAFGVPRLALDAALSPSAVDHARYLYLNTGRAEIAGLRAHDEVLSLPGATPAGQAAARQSNIGGGSTVLEAVQGLTYAPLHRSGMLAPGLRKVGIGALGCKARSGEIGYKVVVNIGAGLDARGGTSGNPLVYPFAGQRDVPLGFPSEVPDLIPNWRPAGFAISVEPSCGRLGGPTYVELRSSQGASVPYRVVSPGTKAVAEGGERTSESIVIVPHRPLEPNTTYRVSVAGTCENRPYSLSWEFATLIGGQCSNREITRAFQVLLGRLPRGSGDDGECRFKDYSGEKSWADWQELAEGVRRRFSNELAPGLVFQTNERGQATILVPDQLSLEEVVNPDRTLGIRALRIVIRRGTPLPENAGRQIANLAKAYVTMDDNGPLDPRLLRTVDAVQGPGGTPISDYHNGPQFATAYLQQGSPKTWGEPDREPVVDKEEWVLNFSGGPQLRWRQGGETASVTGTLR